jgi:tRNA A-37 threonylcarbamoyl transferase component Bud32
VTDSLLGRTIAGKFAIESLIGAGTMGVVYRARHLALDKLVAVKVLRRRVAKDASFAERFRREAKSVSHLDHPNIVRIMDFGEEPDGLLYIAMEHAQGTDLFETMQRDWPISDERIVDVLSQTLGAVAAAHDVGIIHCDLKPENILFVNGRDDEGRRRDIVKVCDFGIARFSEPEHATGKSGEVGETGCGVLLGTPEFMSPEQCSREPVDPRSDVYSIGVMLYQLLVGRVPFEGDSPTDVVYKQAFEEPTPPTKILATVSPKLEAVCLRALCKRPQDRYASAREMRAALREAIDGAVPDPVQRPEKAAARVANVPSGRAALGRDLDPPGGGLRVSLPSPAKVTPPPGRRTTPPPLPPPLLPSPLPPVRPPPLRAPAIAPTSAGPTSIAPKNGANQTIAPQAIASYAGTRHRRSDVWMPLVLAITLGIGATSFVIGAKRNATAPDRPVATPSIPTTASAPATTRTAATESTRVAERTPPTLAPTPVDLDSLPVVEVTRKSGRTKSARASSRPTPSWLASQPSNVPPTPPAPAAPIASEAPPTPPVAAPASRPPPRVDPANGRVSWKVLGVAGGATAGNVARAIDRTAGTWNGCYQSGLRARSENKEGSATLRLACDDQGRVMGATFSGFDMPDVAACIRASSTGVTIPNADTGEASATIGLTFAVRN